MTLTSEIRHEQYERSPEHIQELYRSNGLWLQQICAAFQIPKTQHDEFAISIGDAILGLIPRNKLIPTLMMELDIDHPTAEKIDLAFSKFLTEQEESSPVIPQQAPPSAPTPIASVTPLPLKETVAMGEIPDADSTLRDELLLKPRMTEKIVERAVPEPGTKPLTREEILRSLAAKRTLQSDVSALQQNPPQH